MKNHFDLYKDLIFPSKTTKIFFFVLILLLLIGGYILVEETGGTQYAYLHFLYIPIILAGFVFDVRGGIITGVTAGLLLSSLVPISTPHDLAQPMLSWGLRMGFFMLIGAISGMGASIFRDYLRELDLKQTTDPLTGLPNLTGLERVFSELTQATTVIVVELFQMRSVEQALGTEGTNLLLKEVAENLRQAVGDKGALGILQTQRFAILVPEESNVPEILKNCERASQAPYHIKDIPIFVEMHFGTTRYPDDDQDLNNLTRKAHIAIVLSKNKMEPFSHFDKSMDDQSNYNLVLLHKLKNAINNKELTLEYQPKVFLKTDKVLGFEALLRWNDPVLGLVPPDVFIPLAEETLLINPLAEWALREGLGQMQAWDKLGLPTPLSINFSMKNLYNPATFEALTHLLRTHDIPPHLLEIEVTETSVAASLGAIASALNRLREIGVRIAIDDFGTGQASQHYLLELPIDVIKIDKVFVQSIGHTPAAAAIVKNAILLAHDLNVRVIAEGVETQIQYKLLNEWGCDGGQGYFIGRSMTAEAATQWLRERV